MIWTREDNLLPYMIHRLKRKVRRVTLHDLHPLLPRVHVKEVVGELHIPVHALDLHILRISLSADNEGVSFPAP